MSESLPKSPQESLLLDRRLAALALCLCLVMGAARLFYAWTEPLWFDEAFTLAVISPTGFATFWREVWLDSNARDFTCSAACGPTLPAGRISPCGFRD